MNQIKQENANMKAQIGQLKASNEEMTEQLKTCNDENNQNHQAAITLQNSVSQFGP